MLEGLAHGYPFGGPSCSPLHPGSLNPYPNIFYLIQKRKGFFKKMRDKWREKRLRKPGFLLLPLTNDTVTLGELFAFLGP